MAIEPTAAMCKYYQDVQQVLRPYAVFGRFTQPQHLHLTLCFLGETQRFAAAREALLAVYSRPVELQPAQIGCFSRPGADLWWLGLQPTPELMALQRCVEDALRSAGFALENRMFRPHITLIREGTLRPDPRSDAAFSIPDPVNMLAREITLFESVRRDGRLCYLPRATRELE